jgi:hypothetical protein
MVREGRPAKPPPELTSVFAESPALLPPKHPADPSISSLPGTLSFRRARSRYPPLANAALGAVQVSGTVKWRANF